LLGLVLNNSCHNGGDIFRYQRARRFIVVSSGWYEVALVGTRLPLLDSEAWAAPFELLADKDLSTVIIMLGMLAEVTVLGVFSSSIRRGLFSAPCHSPSLLLCLFPQVAGGAVDLFSVFDLVVSFFWASSY